MAKDSGVDGSCYLAIIGSVSNPSLSDYCDTRISLRILALGLVLGDTKYALIR